MILFWADFPYTVHAYLTTLATLCHSLHMYLQVHPLLVKLPLFPSVVRPIFSMASSVLTVKDKRILPSISSSSNFCAIASLSKV